MMSFVSKERHCKARVVPMSRLVEGATCNENMRYLFLKLVRFMQQWESWKDE